MLFILNNYEQEEIAALNIDKEYEIGTFFIVRHVDGKELFGVERCCRLLDSDHIFVEYLSPSELWRKVNFVQIDGHYIQFGVGVAGRVMKKWGFQIICEQLGDHQKVKFRDNQPIDLALLYEVGHESIDPIAESSHVHKDNPREADLEDLQYSQMSMGKHSQIGSKRRREFNFPLGKRIKMMSTSIFDRWRRAR